MKALELAKEYRETMPPDLMHLWAADSVEELRRLAEVNAELLEALETSANIMKIQRDVVERGQHSSAWDQPIGLAESAIAKAKEQK